MIGDHFHGTLCHLAAARRTDTRLTGIRRIQRVIECGVQNRLPRLHRDGALGAVDCDPQFRWLFGFCDRFFTLFQSSMLGRGEKLKLNLIIA